MLQTKKKIRALVFDLDGTLYLSGKAYPKAVETVHQVAKQVPVYYLSNNTSKSPVFYKNRLQRMGLPLAKGAIISALNLALDAIQKEGLQNIYFFANPEVREWFLAQDPSLNLQSSIQDCELVLMAYHNSMDYQELCELSWRLQRKTRFWVTHTDLVCPDSNGSVPDIGSFLSLFKTAYGIEPERSFGKPNPEILKPLLQAYEPQEILFVGDRLYTDFELAKRTGCRFALPLCGETTLQDIENLQKNNEEIPEIIVDQVSDIDFNSLIQGLI
ncbi:MAG: HAD hydrolase-like protein [Fibrobacter sp.]|jgi:HAD superfamily hydrolase (TIGR01450 family)|nr:HAD hydrolase-like protein [Fibrobacter sp.]